MKKCLSKTIALLLCAVMLCSNLTGVTVFAETAEEKAPVETVEAQVPAAQETLPETETIPQETVVETEPAATEPAEVLTTEETAEETVKEAIAEETIAEETIAEESNPVKEETSALQRPSSKVIEEESHDVYNFTTFDDLKIMAANPETYGDGEGLWKYMGPDPFVFEESIELPGGQIDFSSVKTIVPVGVNVIFYDDWIGSFLQVGDLLLEGSVNVDCLTIEGKAEVKGTLNSWIVELYYGGELYVEGNVDTEEFHLWNENIAKIMGSLSVSGWFTIDELSELYVEGEVACCDVELQGKMEVMGTMNLAGIVYVDNNAELSGIENIVFGNDGCSVQYAVDIYDVSDLKEAIANAEQSDNPRVSYSLNWNVYGNESLQESLSIPENCCLYLFTYEDDDVFTFTVAENEALTINGELTVDTILCVKGVLENNGSVYVNGSEAGRITVADSGTYAGEGNFKVSAETDSVSDLSTILVGLNVDSFNFKKKYDDYYGCYFWYAIDISDLPKLPAPTELRWGYTLDVSWDEDSQTWEDVVVKGAPGTILWKSAQPSQYSFVVDIYQICEYGDEFVAELGGNFSAIEHGGYGCSEPFEDWELESGDYYFTVISKGDGIEYADSEPAISDIWNYVKPVEKIGDCSTPIWNGREVNWTGPKCAKEYEVRWYFSADKDKEPEWYMGTYVHDETVDSLEDFFVMEKGVGYYYIRVRARSTNIEEYCHGDWSEMSDPYYVSEKTLEVCKLGDILFDDTLSTEEKVSAVHALDNQELKKAMIQDKYFVNRIAALEGMAGGAARVEVTEAVKDFDQSKVSVVGANLNNAANAAEDIKLVVDKPEKNHVIPEVFHNSVAVSFSMNLENVKNPHDLEVPVEITLPIPATLNPEFLVILHYDVDGNYEQIEPHISYRGNQYYASFVVSGFSDFMMLSQDNGLKGDMNGDGSVNDDDVILLLWHTLLPELYPVEGEADFTADGNVNDEDVIYLLWHTLIPELYPL